MASSGTYTFESSNSDTVLGAFGRLQIRPTELVTEHLRQAYRQANLLNAEWANKQVNLWTEETVEVDLTDGTKTYDLDPTVLMILIGMIRTGSDDNPTDTIITPLSTTDYWAQPNKESAGKPTSFWFNRQITPQVTFWQVPNADDTYTAVFQCVRQIQDANLASGQTPEIPYAWLDAYEAGLAYRLSRYYKPELEDKRKMDYMEAWNVAATFNVENVPLMLTPMLSAYRSPY